EQGKLTDELDIDGAATPAAPPPEKEPPWAWAIVAASFTASLFGWGTIFAGGIWQRYFYTHGTFGDATQKELAWVGSIAYASCTVLGVLVGRVSDLWGHQRVLAAGTLLFTISMLLSSFTTALWQLYLSQGVLYGLGVACLYIPASGVLVTWWTTRRTLAISLAGMGSGVGGFIWPQVIQALLDGIDFRWTYRILAAMGFVVLSLCTWVLKPKDTGMPKAKRGPFIDTSFFRSIHYWLLSGVGLVVTFGYYVPTYYLPQYASDLGLATNIGSLLVGVMNGAALLFRPIQAPLARWFGASPNFAAAITLGALCQLLIWPFSKNLGSLMTFAVAFGLVAAGGYLGYFPVVVAEAFPKQYASALGLVFAWCSFGGLTGPVISGALFDANSVFAPDGARTTNYLPMQLFGGFTMLAAGMI
ncbi:major facilitator superfamily domain-containing protein, partial [Hyaloraphidium curvatum]